MATLKVGTNGSQTMELQQFLKSIGLYNGAIDGIFGPKTDKGVKDFQKSQGIKVDGIVGPITQTKISSYGNKVQAANDPAVQAMLQNDPQLAEDVDKLVNSGDIRADNLFDYVSNYAGQPYSEKEVKRYVKEESRKLQAFYDEQKTADQGDIEDALGLNQRDYERYMTDSAGKFSSDKEASDVDSANRGVLFSTGRQQELQGLQNAASSDLAAKQDEVSTAARTALRGFQTKWGGDVNDLKSYMKIGSQNYDAFTPGGVVKASGIKQFYNPSDYKLSGTKKAEQADNAARNAFARLANLTNKSSKKSYQMQF